MKIARRSGPDKRALVVLVVIPAGIPRQLVAQVHAQVEHWLVVGVLRRALRLQDIELRNAAVDVCDAAPHIDSCDPIESKSGRGRSEASVVCIERVRQQRIRRLVRRTRGGTGHERESHPSRRCVGEADQSILDHIVIVECQIHSELLARDERSGDPIVPVMPDIIGE